ncbi:MAG: putative hydro-lyase [Pseudomonadota bacterium]
MSLAEQQMARGAQDFRSMVRAGGWRAPTAGIVPGALQANLAVVPAEAAEEFFGFCMENPRPCPLLARTEMGARDMPGLGTDIDVAVDIPAYRIFRDGVRAERVESLATLWRPDFVAFAIGCSYSFEAAMEEARIDVRHISRGKNVPMYRSGIQTVPVGRFSGPMVVSMRPIAPGHADRVRELCAAFPHAHGAPVHIGDPAEIGIADVHTPDFGDTPDIEPGEICAFWACGVTPQLALLGARLEIAATHEPGHMLVTDRVAAVRPPDWRAA